MSTETSTCPEDLNSTDCLLRAVIQTLKEKPDQEEPTEFSWDPLNFAFAVILGVLAALIALPALYHAVYNTEKRRKVNHRAIGAWSNIKERAWVGADMSFQYTAKTPVYRMDGFQEWIDTKPDPSSQSKGTSRLSRLRSLMRKSGFFVIPLPLKQGVPAAGWITFSQKTGLDAWITPKDTRQLRSVNVEHLPDDIVAAPAYAEVGVVLVAAAAAGIRRSNFDEKFENAFVASESFQLDFLRHPLLGLIGTFTHYDAGSCQGRNTTRGKLDAAREHALGLVRLRKGVTAVPGLIDMTLGSDYSMDRIRTLYEEKQPMVLLLRSPMDFPSYFFMEFDLVHPYIIHIHHLFQASSPKYIPAFFPRAKAGLSGDYSLDALVLNGKYWSAANVKKFAEAPILHWPQIVVGSNSFKWIGIDSNENRRTDDLEDHPLPSWRRFQWEEKAKTLEGLSQSLDTRHADNAKAADVPQKGHEGGKAEKKSEEKAGDDGDIQKGSSYGESDNCEAINQPKVVCGFPVVLHMCMKLLDKPSDIKKWFFGSDLETKALLRRLVFKQLRHVDAWLETEAQVELRIGLLFRTWLLLLATEDKFELSSKPEKIDTPEKRQPPDSSPVQEADRDTIYDRHSKMILWLRMRLEPSEPVDL